jgi:hypothetical protein
MGSITQIYSSTQGEQTKNINKTLPIETSISITPVYQYSQKQVVIIAVQRKQ